MRGWVGASTVAAPLALIGGWTWAAARQPSSYDSVRDTVSALAARGATDRWIMTTALALLGVCHVATAYGLTDAGVPARAVLVLGGFSTAAVAALPQPGAGHVPAATVSFLALALWPSMVARSVRRVGAVASVILVVLLIWLGFELGSGTLLGLSERLLAGAEALCPLVIAGIFVRRRSRGSATE